MEAVILGLQEGFKSVQPDITIGYTGSGSGAGITGVLDGTCDLGPEQPRPLRRREGSGAPLRTSSPRTASPSSSTPKTP